MSATPETDAAIKAQSEWKLPFVSYTMGGVTYDGPVATLCRRLERERDKAREALADVEEYGTEDINAAVDLRHKLATALVERDEARGDLENHTASTIHSCHDQCQRLMCVLRRERDDARRDLDNMQDQRDLAMKVIKRLEQERDKATEDLNAANKSLQYCSRAMDQLESTSHSLSQALQTFVPLLDADITTMGRRELQRALKLLTPLEQQATRIRELLEESK
jgi:chromosome segregation ATPase